MVSVQKLTPCSSDDAKLEKKIEQNLSGFSIFQTQGSLKIKRALDKNYFLSIQIFFNPIY